MAKLTKDEILELADVFAKRPEYTMTHDRPSKYMVRDIFDELQRRGLLREGVSVAYETARVEEVFQENIYLRFVGWAIQGGFDVGRQQSESNAGRNDHQGSRSLYGSTSTDLVLRAQYGYPFSLSLHWFSEVSLRIPVYGKQKRVGQSLLSELFYQLGERFSNSLRIEFAKTAAYHDATSSMYNLSTFSFATQTSVSDNFRYYIEDNVSAGIRITYTDGVSVLESEDDAYFSTGRSTRGTMSVSLGFDYRIF